MHPLPPRVVREMERLDVELHFGEFLDGALTKISALYYNSKKGRVHACGTAFRKTVYTWARCLSVCLSRGKVSRKKRMMYMLRTVGQSVLFLLLTVCKAGEAYEVNDCSDFERVSTISPHFEDPVLGSTEYEVGAFAGQFPT